MSELIFKEDIHEYWLGSRRLPSVTEVFDAHGLISSFAKDEYKANRGSIVHQCGALYVMGKLDINSVDERVSRYVESYIKLLDHTGWIATSVEERAYHPYMDYAGTFDVCFDDDWVIDLKSGAPAPWHALQVAAYKELIAQSDIGIIPSRRGTVYLQADGSIAKLKEHTDRNDFKIFASFLNCYYWRKNNGISDRRD